MFGKYPEKYASLNTNGGGGGKRLSRPTAKFKILNLSFGQVF